MEIFTKNKSYFLPEILDVCENNGLVTVDCLKDENMISVEEWNNGDLGDCVWEFKRIGDDLFRLSYVDKIYLKSFLKIGKITMQRKGGDAGRDSAKMLQFKINPVDLFSD